MRGGPGALGELIHEAVRRAIEVAVEEELTAALGAARYARDVGRGGYRNGHRPRTLTGPTGPLALTLPRATLFSRDGRAGMDVGARPPLPAPTARGQRGRGGDLPGRRATPGGSAGRSRRCSRRRRSRRVPSRGSWARSRPSWRPGAPGPLAELDVFGLYLDAIALRVRSAGKVVSVPVLGVVAILTDGQKQLVALELCGGESFEAWKGCLDDLVSRGPRSPGGLRDRRPRGAAEGRRARLARGRVQRCAVHKLRNLERKAPKHALAEIRADFHRIVYAESRHGRAQRPTRPSSGSGAPRCPGVVRSLQEGGEELLTFFRVPQEPVEDAQDHERD